MRNAIAARPQSSSIGDGYDVTDFRASCRTLDNKFGSTTTVMEPLPRTVSQNADEFLKNLDFKLNTFERGTPREYVLKDSNTTTTTVEVFRSENDGQTDFYQLPPAPGDDQKRFTYVPAKGPPYEKFSTTETKFAPRPARSVSPTKTVQWNENPEVFEMNSNYSERSTEKRIRAEEEVTRTISPTVPYTVQSPAPTITSPIEIQRTTAKNDAISTITTPIPSTTTPISSMAYAEISRPKPAPRAVDMLEPATNLNTERNRAVGFDEDGYAYLTRGSQTNLSDLYAPILQYSGDVKPAESVGRGVDGDVNRADGGYVTPRGARGYGDARASSSRADSRGYTTQPPTYQSTRPRDSRPYQTPSQPARDSRGYQGSTTSLTDPRGRRTPSVPVGSRNYRPQVDTRGNTLPSRSPQGSRAYNPDQYPNYFNQNPDWRGYVARTPSRESLVNRGTDPVDQRQPRSLHRTRRTTSASPDYTRPNLVYSPNPNTGRQSRSTQRSGRSYRSSRDESDILRQWERELSRSPSPWR
uniref:Proteoglycan 4 n=1 Tax=Bursaphelenchus xylophilus TaxID=6326 RepID=A0A1I7S6V7_BURXY